MVHSSMRVTIVGNKNIGDRTSDVPLALSERHHMAKGLCQLMGIEDSRPQRRHRRRAA